MVDQLKMEIFALRTETTKHAQPVALCPALPLYKELALFSFSDPKFFWGIKFLFGPSFFLSKFFWTKNLFGPTNFLEPKMNFKERQSFDGVNIAYEHEAS